ncbi:MAG: VOC family protein [Verrucomicrobiota bacterium]|jgi:catechol 2,3-dioxygenase
MNAIALHQARAPAVLRLPDETHVSRVHLRTTDLARALDFYQRVIGLKLRERGESGASLSATGGRPALLILTEDRNAVPRPQRATGLYHLAIRFPTRRDLAHALRRLVAAEYPITGASDHVIGESLHLDDPDGNGVELYYDRPRSQWPMRNGQFQMVTQPLDVGSLLGTTNGESIPANAPPQTDIGHLNLHVADLKEAETFFHDFLGLDVMARIGNTVTFLAAGGYHHHVAVNTWAGKTPAPKDSIGLISYGLAVPHDQTLAGLKERAPLFGCEARMAGDVLQVRDPNGHWLELDPG